MAGVRERARQELLNEIKDLARTQLAEVGAAGLSLRQISRDLDLVSSAIYRYYPSRDELLTALIIDAFNALGSTAETADAEAKARNKSPRQRWAAISNACRAWALAHPAEYALIYGSPVPGYQAPLDTVSPASRLSTVLIGLLADEHASNPLHTTHEPIPRALRADLKKLLSDAGITIPEAVLVRGMTSWVQLLGLISFELFGHLNNVVNERDLFFELQMQRMADQIGFGP
jgi:AcrR family transcriptional regulator